MTTINSKDFINSIADSLQYISYTHPRDFVQAMTRAYENEKSPAAKDAMAQILINSRMAAMGQRPICQDTGIVTVFLRIGMECRFDTFIPIQELVDEGVRLAYNNAKNPLRASVVADPAGKRINTKDNTPAVIYTELVAGSALDIRIAAKGGGSENKSRFVTLNPNDSIVDWVVKTAPTMGAGWCPPGILGIGIGGTVDKAMVLAKESLMEPINMQELQEKGPENSIEALRLEIYERVNELGIGAQGLGGLTTVLDVKIFDCPTHAASLPVAMIPNCAATRHIHFILDGSGPAHFAPPRLEDWPKIEWEVGESVKRVQLDGISKEEIASWKPGETLLLNGTILTGRDAAHRRIQSLLEKGDKMPDGVDFKGKFIYYVGPVDPVNDEAVGPAGPTTSTRMDKYTDMMLDRKSVVKGKSVKISVALGGRRIIKKKRTKK